VTVAVQQLEVVGHIWPPATSREKVIDFHPIAVCKEQSTGQAPALLSLQEARESGRDLRMLPKAGTPIHPIAIVGAAHAVDLYLPTDRCLPVAVEVELTVGRLKDPTVARGEVPIPVSNPAFALVRVAVGGPGT